MLSPLGIVVVGVLLGPGDRPAADSVHAREDPIEILKKVDEATKGVGFVKYHGKLEGLEEAAGRVETVEGTVVMKGWNPDAGVPRRYRSDVTIRRSWSGETRHVTIGADGETIFLIDHDARKVYEGATPAVLGTRSAPAVAIWLREFVHPTPFSDEIHGDAQTLNGVRTIGDEPCYEIHVVYQGAIGEAVWWFSKRDYLPRRVQRIFTTPAGTRAIQQWTITELVVDPNVPPDTFKPSVPPGYTKADAPAP